MDTAASRWQIIEKVKGNKVIRMGNFNISFLQLNKWQEDNNLIRAHHNIDERAQEHRGRKFSAFYRSPSIQTHIDHIYHSNCSPIEITSAGAIDHPHI